ncbi:hypothetical protein LZ30DRAFT_199050 [Colletotrichum cereale]|nr:hypothetical protein LZ30DRAFT_199050 [Colletotrichum cereale]
MWEPLIASRPRLWEPSPSSLRSLVQLGSVIVDQPVQPSGPLGSVGWLLISSDWFRRCASYSTISPSLHLTSPHLSATHTHSTPYTRRGINVVFLGEPIALLSNRFIIVSPFLSPLAFGLESPPVRPPPGIVVSASSLRSSPLLSPTVQCVSFREKRVLAVLESQRTSKYAGHGMSMA